MNQPTHRTEGPQNTSGREHPRTGNRPVKKEVFGSLIGSGALVILYAADQLGVPMDLEVALAIAGLIGAGAAYLKGE